MSNSTSQISSASASRSAAEPSQSTSESASKTTVRSIGRWRIGETLGKGGYSWVKKGHDKKTNKCVALKFMKKADASWEKEQTKQIITEIECLKQVRHPNVLKLYAYNLNAKYPTKDPKERIDATLLVLEYAPGGEIFDILYYTRALESVLARTYFTQAINGLEAIHMASIAHRDLKPQNLLLDSRFNLKICDFGLSKIFESDADSIMETTYVGTRGYQAPELLLNKNYDLSCDIFSLGVVLFILINGYPPFEQASDTDRWFQPLVSGDSKKFWKLHKHCKIRKDDKCKDLLQRMLAFDPKKRITINEIKKHDWFNGKCLDAKELIRALKKRHREMEQRRREDGRKLKDLQTSVPQVRAINFGDLDCDVYPEEEIEGVNDNEQYSTYSWKDILETLKAYVGKNYGVAEYDAASKTMHCGLKLSNMNMASEKKVGEEEFKFDVNVFKSRDFIVPQNVKNDVDVKAVDKQDVVVVRFTKFEGNTDKWIKIRNGLLLGCSSVINGLPEWALSSIDNDNNGGDECKEENDKNVDDYLLNEEINWDIVE